MILTPYVFIRRHEKEHSWTRHFCRYNYALILSACVLVCLYVILAYFPQVVNLILAILTGQVDITIIFLGKYNSWMGKDYRSRCFRAKFKPFFTPGQNCLVSVRCPVSGYSCFLFSSLHRLRNLRCSFSKALIRSCSYLG